MDLSTTALCALNAILFFTSFPLPGRKKKSVNTIQLDFSRAVKAGRQLDKLKRKRILGGKRILDDVWSQKGAATTEECYWPWE